MPPTYLYLTTLLIFPSLTGQINDLNENIPQNSSVLMLAENDNPEEPEFEDTDNLKDTIGAASRYNFEGDGRPQPGNRKGGASRGNCPPTQPSLTALIPAINLGLTTQKYPTFWFYIPYSYEDLSQAEFMLLDENQRPTLEKPISIELSETPGIIGVTLPSTVKPLELEQEYHWFFELVCDSENPSNNPRVDGWIKRVQPSQDLLTQLDNNQAEQSYLIYAKNGIWYDALTSIILTIQENPSNSTLKNDWFNLLESVELQELIDSSITDCCSPR
ncbi:DUF928 domain-containing protein [Lyngbya sp. PCC 8106]|uniref:DUF928 domain-containing protein n=1 Tax=Lyngbya sp. (strain PCC 8106) TaxID=313612 RepID=UPI0000EA9C42|nr:DUF928 domain-containing protein [Lyngbya sp. PCC 8106]EAW33432.1 hypothetical protein L8106_02827 [Lyngbya sp. PCC 8106]